MAVVILECGISGKVLIDAPYIQFFKILVSSPKVFQKLNIVLQRISNNIQANDEQSRTLAAVLYRLLPKPMSGNIRIISEKISSEEILQC